MKSVCVFCASSRGRDPRFMAAATELGTSLARRGLGVVYGGAHVGLMGAVADAALAAGGSVIGIMPRSMADREVAHTGLTQLHLVTTMHERKAMMATLSDAFIALPGGYGTMDEFFEALTWAQLGYHAKPCVLVNIAGFFDPLLHFLEGAVREGLLHPGNRSLILVADSVESALRLVASPAPAPANKWS